MPPILFWFRNDLRLLDPPALHRAIDRASAQGAGLLPVCLVPPPEPSRWGFPRTGPHRTRFNADTRADLSARLAALGSGLWVIDGGSVDDLAGLARRVGARDVVCEAIEAPQERAAVDRLRAAGLAVETVWQSSLLHPADLPWAADAVPDVFTAFRQGVERAAVRPRTERPAPPWLPPWPEGMPRPPAATDPPASAGGGDPRSSFPHTQAAFQGGETAALAHLHQYLARGLPHRYKDTRNGLSGIDFSSKWSPWLATGALSPRSAFHALKAFEAEHGASDGSHWLWFELLWRDHFRFMQLKHGTALYRRQGLSPLPAHRELTHNVEHFERWCEGRTGQPLVDAGMRELHATGYLSNRLRQVVASCLVHDLACDWRAGAAWFESQLLDFDVHSNQGNWLYIAGRGTDPRGGRRFNVEKQAQAHDPHGVYQALWA